MYGWDLPYQLQTNILNREGASSQRGESCHVASQFLFRSFVSRESSNSLTFLSHFDISSLALTISSNEGPMFSKILLGNFYSTHQFPHFCGYCVDSR